MQRSTVIAGAAGLLMSAMVGVSHALPIISNDPVKSDATVSGVFTVDLMWHANTGGELVSVWDVDMMVDQSIIDYIFEGSGPDGFTDSSVWIGTDEIGVLGQFQRSNIYPLERKILQDKAGKNAVTSAVQFMALAATRSNHGVGVNAVSDGLRQQLTVHKSERQACGPADADPGACATVPVPGVLWLMVWGMLGMLFSCRRRLTPARKGALP